MGQRPRGEGYIGTPVRRQSGGAGVPKMAVKGSFEKTAVSLKKHQFSHFDCLVDLTWKGF